MTASTLANGLKAQPSGKNRWMGSCPAHDDTTPSLSITDANGKVLVKCHAGCRQSVVIDALRSRGLWPEKRDSKSSEGPNVIKAYDYLDENGELLFQVTRCRPTPNQKKPFYPRYPDGRGGWTYKKHDRQILYNLPAVLGAAIIFVTEGEKDADTLIGHGLVATTNAGGAEAAWLPRFTDALKGREVILIPDNDKPGRNRVARIARALAGSVKRLLILELADGKDVTDWFEAGHSETELLNLIARTEIVQ